MKKEINTQKQRQQTLSRGRRIERERERERTFLINSKKSGQEVGHTPSTFTEFLQIFSILFILSYFL